jgi:hypothetical protein
MYLALLPTITPKAITMNDYYYKEEAELAVKWYEVNDIQAYVDSDEISVYVVCNDMHILISGSELSYRADLYREHYLEETL